MSRVSMSTEPEAMRLADALDAQVEVGGGDLGELKDASVELRRLALKQWVGLTDEEICRIKAQINGTLDVQFVVFTRAIEAKLKEKNT